MLSIVTYLICTYKNYYKLNENYYIWVNTTNQLQAHVEMHI